MDSIFLEFLGAGNVPKALIWATEKLSALADKLKIPAMLVFALGALVALFVGVVGYKCIKLISAISFGVAGYAIGYALFATAKGQFNWNIPGFVGIIIGVVLLGVLGYLAFRKFAYALYGLIWFAAFVFTYFVFHNYLLAAAIGLAVALLSMYFVRIVVAIITASSGGFALVAMLSAMLPKVTYLSLSQGVTGKVVAVVVSLIFVAIQLGTTMPKKNSKGKQGLKRVKIRRVFDAW